MQENDLHSFDPIGLTPPRGRQGHSVPTPRPLGGEGSTLNGGGKGLSSANHPFTSKLDILSAADVQHSGSSCGGGNAVSPAQFYAHRDHIFGGSLSKLDRMRSFPDPQVMEALDETEEYESTYMDDSHGDKVTFKYPVSPTRKGSDEQDASRRSSSGHPGRSMNMSLDKLTGDSLLFFSYSAASSGGGLNPDHQLGGSFVRAFTQGLNTSLSVPYLQSTSPGPGASSSDQFHLFPSVARNPNKAIITIDALNSRILTANEMTCELFGFQRDELSGMKIQKLFTEPYSGEQRALMEQNISASGEMVVISGKVMDAVTSYGIEFPVSVWMRKIRTDTISTKMDPSGLQPQTPPSPRIIVVIEPVERSSAVFSIDASHVIASCDPWFACLFGFQDSNEVIGKDVAELIPSLKLPITMEELTQVPPKQAVTGRARDGTVFPLTVKFTENSQSLSVGDLYSPTHITQQNKSSQPPATASPLDNSKQEEDKAEPTSPSKPSTTMTLSSPDHSPSIIPSPSTLSPGDEDHTYINAKVVVYAALSGMISFFPDGTIHGCNHHFALMLFGYKQQELLKRDITFLIPDFYYHIGYVDDRNMPFPPIDEEDCLFHSAAEKSMSPDKVSDYARGLSLSPSRKKSQQHLQSPGRHAPPLQFPDTSFNSTSEQDLIAHSSPKKGKTEVSCDTSCNTVDDTAKPEPTHRTLDQNVSCDLKLDVIPSAQSIKSTSESVLPPVPNRLAPSQSTERIMEILNQHGLVTESDTTDLRLKSSLPEEWPTSSTKKNTLPEEEKELPLASTPATKSEETTSSSINFQLGSSQDLDGSSLASAASIPEGTYVGDARHKDGSLMAVVFQLKQITLADGQKIFCMWLSRDLDMERARTADLSMSMSQLPSDPYRQNLIISPDVGVADGGIEDTDTAASASNLPDHPHFPHHYSQTQQQQATEELIAMEGEYKLNYNTLRPIGKGAFGFVRLAQKLDNKSLVVVKFLRKSSVLKDCWVKDEEMGVVPLEIALLARLSHDNIVQLLEAYENEYFFQMVMEKHGEGLDLFEFIERSPKLNEQHISYIFRQMVAALAYLHGKNIVHRDIKDENIIINQCFHIKLIDFGSAAYMAPGKLFNTFCGTLEYCSPEVLLGNSYSGPELEMWALGVTLYTLVFGENPFYDVEETISGHLQPPFLTSPGLMKVLFWLLHPDPRSRATVRDLQKDKWTNQAVDDAQLNFDVVLGNGSAQGEETTGHRHAHKNTGPVKCNSEGEAMMLMKSIKEHLIVSDKERKGGGARN